MRWGGLETGQLEESGVTFPGSGNQGVTRVGGVASAKVDIGVQPQFGNP